MAQKKKSVTSFEEYLGKWDFWELYRIRFALQEQETKMYQVIAASIVHTDDTLHSWSDSYEAHSRWKKRLTRAFDTVDTLLFEKCPFRKTLHMNLKPGEKCPECEISVPISFAKAAKELKAARKKRKK